MDAQTHIPLKNPTGIAGAVMDGPVLVNEYKVSACDTPQPIIVGRGGKPVGFC